MMADAPLSFATLAGSLRKGSYNVALARALPALAPEGVEVAAPPSLADIPLYNQDVQDADGFPPAIEAIADALRAADGIIIVTPEYNHSIPGVLKNAIDWLSRLEHQPFNAKPVAIQSASRGMLGGARSQVHLRGVLVALRATAFTAPEVFVGSAHAKFDESGTLTDQPTRDAVAKQLAAFAAFVRKAG
jgi:chromate reductase